MAGSLVREHRKCREKKACRESLVEKSLNFSGMYCYWPSGWSVSKKVYGTFGKGSVKALYCGGLSSWLSVVRGPIAN